jgi:hypothetical protein
VSLTDDARVVIYNHKMFKVQEKDVPNKGCHSTQHNDTQHNDTLYNYKGRHSTQKINDIQHCDIQNNGLNCDTQHNGALHYYNRQNDTQINVLN